MADPRDPRDPFVMDPTPPLSPPMPPPLDEPGRELLRDTHREIRRQHDPIVPMEAELESIRTDARTPRIRHIPGGQRHTVVDEDVFRRRRRAGLVAAVFGAVGTAAHFYLAVLLAGWTFGALGMIASTGWPWLLVAGVAALIAAAVFAYSPWPMFRYGRLVERLALGSVVGSAVALLGVIAVALVFPIDGPPPVLPAP